MTQEINRTPEQTKLALKRYVHFFYDIQRLRLQCAGRTYQRPDGVNIYLHEVDVAILESRAKGLEKAEKEALSDVAHCLQTIPFYTEILSDKSRFKGIGPTMAGVILSEYDINRYDTVSKMWAFAGLRPMPAYRCKTCHSVMRHKDLNSFEHEPERVFKKKFQKDPEREVAPKKPCSKGKFVNLDDVYESGMAQRPHKGETLTYNAWLRAKLVGVLGSVLLRVNSPWRKFYDDYKHRKTSAGWGKNDGHRHNAAVRYMVKQLLLEIWREWRTFQGLSVRPPYAEEYLGRKHHAASSTTTAQETRPVDMATPEIEAELAMLEP